MVAPTKAALWFFLLALAAPAPSPNVSPNLVRLFRAGDSFCTGAVVRSQQEVVTAAHCVNPPGNTIRRPDTITSTAAGSTVLADNGSFYWTAADVAFLRLQGSLEPHSDLGSFKEVTTASLWVVRGNVAREIHVSFDAKYSHACDGLDTRASMRHCGLADAEVCEGDSGAPYVAGGRIVGVHSSHVLNQCDAKGCLVLAEDVAAHALGDLVTLDTQVKQCYMGDCPGGRNLKK